MARDHGLFGKSLSISDHICVVLMAEAVVFTRKSLSLFFKRYHTSITTWMIQKVIKLINRIIPWMLDSFRFRLLRRAALIEVQRQRRKQAHTLLLLWTYSHTAILRQEIIIFYQIFVLFILLQNQIHQLILKKD